MSTFPLIRRSFSDIQAAFAASTQGFIDLSALITVPNTQIVGRAQIPNLAADLKTSMA